MYLYWLIFSFLAFLSIIDFKIEKNLGHILKLFLLIFLTVFIGLRHKVGGDWEIYQYDFYNNINYFNLLTFDFVRDFGYELFSFIFHNIGFGIYGLNLFLSIIFIYSLHKFALQLKENYWLTFLIAFPYLILIVAMGYTRQATAFAFMLLSLSSINNKNIFTFFIFSIFAILFHKSSIIMLFLIFISYFKFNFKSLIVFPILGLFSFYTVFPELDRITSGYLNEFSKYQSPGVKFRIAINIFSGIFFISFYKKLKFNSGLDRLMILTLISNLILVFFMNNFSTFVDRIIIYLSFSQIVVFSRIYLITENYKILANFSIVFLYFIIFFFWINFSYHSYAWLPYQNLLFITK